MCPWWHSDFDIIITKYQTVFHLYLLNNHVLSLGPSSRVKTTGSLLFCNYDVILPNQMGRQHPFRLQILCRYNTGNYWNTQKELKKSVVGQYYRLYGISEQR